MSINYHTHTLPLVGHLSVLQTGEAKLPREVLTRQTCILDMLGPTGPTGSSTSTKESS